jgi:hypothetical protein
MKFRELKICLSDAVKYLNLKISALLLVLSLINYFVPQHVLVGALAIACLVVPFITLLVEFVLVTFSPVRQIPQPKRSLLMGFGGGTLTALLWLLPALAGQAAIALVVVGIVTVGGALIGLLGSAETISSKIKDEVIERRDYGQFYGSF